ncbi:MAG: polyamine aminopropyltransferase [Bacillota bacterium]|nr:polyamine aminopropyltransferase [Candidatus Fermentithermobacillaceae bacterium]
MELWFTEEWVPGLELSVQVKSIVHKAKTKFQELAIYDTEALGRILVLDDVIQTTEIDEHIYHECIVHVPLLAHPNPEEVLIVGGGDGGSLREVLKHPSVKRATLVDIDEGVIEASKRFLPQWNTGWSDPRARVVIANGLDFVAKAKEEYDVVIVDSTDPIGPGEALFREEFYRSIKGALRPGGVMSAQTENPIFMPDLVRTVFGRVANVFPVAKLYTGPMPTYPGGFWCYTCATLGPDPSEPVREPQGLAFRYYSPEIHRRAFVLPPEVARSVNAR